MPPENLLQYIQNLFSGEKKQTSGKPGKKIHAGKWTYEELLAQRRKGRIDKYFGTGVGLKKIDYEKFNLVDSFIKNLYDIEPGATEMLEAEERPIGAIQFIENAMAGRSGFGYETEPGTIGFKYKIPFPGIANIMTNPNISKKQLGDALKGYTKLYKNPKSKEPFPTYRVPQELLSAFGKENAPVIKEFLKQMYPEGDYTSVADIQGAMQLGDKPGGLTVDIGSFLSPEYMMGGLGGWRRQPDFMETPSSGKYAAYQNRPDAIAKNIALERLQTSANPLKEIVTSFGEESKYRSGIPTSPASINLASAITMPSSFYNEWAKVGGGEAARIGRTLLHEIGHSSPQFVERYRKGYDSSLHQTPFHKMIEQSYENLRPKMQQDDVYDPRHTGLSKSSIAIKRAFLESDEYQQMRNHPVAQYVQMLLDSGLHRARIYGSHLKE